MALRMNTKLGVTGNELTDLFLAFIVLSLAFGWVFGGAGNIVEMFMVASVAVGTGFILHEMAHKFAAQRYGYTAEFRASTFGLMFTVLTAAMGFIFAAPGAVVIGRRMSTESPYAHRPDAHKYTREDDRYWDVHDTRVREELVISIAGIVVNMLMVCIFIMVLFVTPAAVASSDILFLIIYLGIYVNIFLAAFNLIPFGPLDGAKILACSPIAFGVAAVVVFGSFIWFVLLGHIADLFYMAWGF